MPEAWVQTEDPPMMSRMGVLGWNSGGLRKQATFIQELVAGRFAIVLLQEAEGVTALMTEKYHIVDDGGYLVVAFAKWYFVRVKDVQKLSRSTPGTWGIVGLAATGVLRRALPCGTTDITACTAHLNNKAMRKPEVGRSLCRVLDEFMQQHNVDIAHADFNEGVKLRGASSESAVDDVFGAADAYFQAGRTDPRWLFGMAKGDCCGFLMRKTHAMNNMRVQRHGDIKDLHGVLSLKPSDEGAHSPNFVWLAHLSVSEAERRGEHARQHRQERALTRRERQRKREREAAANSED